MLHDKKKFGYKKREKYNFYLLDSGIKTQRHPQNRKYITYRNSVKGGPSHCHRQCTKFGEIGLVVFDFEICHQTEKYTDRQTDILITMLSASPGVELRLKDKK